MFKSLCLLIQMTAHAQFMELLFDNVLNFGIGFVTVKAHPHASIVNVVVVATDTGLVDMICVSEIHSQQITLWVRHKML